MQKNETAAIKLIEVHNSIVEDLVKQYDGNVIKHIGDEVLVDFSSAVIAVRFAIALQSKLYERNRENPEEDKLLVRIGIHIGDVIIKDNDLFGDGVNIASRVRPIANPGGICITEAVYDSIKNQKDIECICLGLHELKNVKSKIKIYAIVDKNLPTKINTYDKKGRRNNHMEKIDEVWRNEEKKQTIFRLAHFNPSAIDNYGNQIIDYLVLDSLATFGPLLLVSASQIKSYIKNSFHLDFAEAEINASGKRLGYKKMIEYIEGTLREKRKGEKPRFRVLTETKEKIERNLNAIMKLEKDVLDEWKEEICNRYEEHHIVLKEIDLIEENLKRFISRIFMRHGVESVALLYPDEERTQKWLKFISDDIWVHFPISNPIIESITRLEIPKFFKSKDPVKSLKRQQYITSVFNGSFFWHMVQVDEKCSRLLREVTKGQKLVLDNNIIYSLVGLHGTYLLKSVHNMLRMADKLEYKLIVTTKTIAEFHESLKHRINQIKPISKDLARIAIENLDEDHFMVCYWKKFVKNGTSIHEFIAEKSHLKKILDGLKIDTIDEFRKEIEFSEELKEEESLLRQVVPMLNDHIIEHDAFHRVLIINKIRVGERYQFTDAKAWFLTHDTKLPSYDKIARKGKRSLPFCLLTNQWIQINRPLLARTLDEKEYEESYYTLVTQPYLRAMLSSLPIEKAYNQVLGRLNHYKNMNRQLALYIVTDTHFMATIATETDDEKITEKIKDKFVDLSHQLQKDKETLIEDAKQKEKELNILKERITDIDKRITKTEDKYQEEHNKLIITLEDEKTKRKSAENAAKDAYHELDEIKKKNAKEKLQSSAKRRLIIFFCIFLILETISVIISQKHGVGDNIWQKIVSFSLYTIVIAPIISLFTGWFVIGKKRLYALGWPWNKIFKVEFKEGINW